MPYTGGYCVTYPYAMQQILIDLQKWFTLQMIMNIVVALIIIVIAWIVAKLARRAVLRMFKRRKVDMTAVNFLARMLSALIMTLGLLMAISRLGVPIASLITVIGAAGVAIAFALRNSLSNVAAGIILAVMRPIHVGKYIEVSGKEGSVDEVGLLYTRITTSDNKRVIIPNNQLMNNAVTNFSVYESRRNDLIIGIGYDDDMNKAIKVIHKVLAAESRVLDKPAEPLIAVTELADSSVNLLVRYWTARADLLPTKMALTQAIKQALDKANINIPYPQRDVHLHQAK